MQVLKNLKKYYAEGQLVQCVVVDSTKRLLELSMIGELGHSIINQPPFPPDPLRFISYFCQLKTCMTNGEVQNFRL